MKAYIDHSIPTDDFWTAYDHLWENSTDQPVFEAPSVLKYFATLSIDALAVFKCYREGGQLIGAALFHQKKGVYSFLSDYKTDYSCFVLHQTCTEAETKQFFKKFHQEVKNENWTLVLNNQPMWVSYMDIFTQSGKKSPLFWLSSQSSVCPRLEESSPDSLLKNLHKSRNNKYKRNRLLREQNAEFEVLDGADALEEWTEGFCQTHVIRWDDTITPSKYRSEEKRQLLLGCMNSWANDGRLVRLALKVGDTRIAFVIGLIQKNCLIYHSLTYHPDFHKYSPGKVLLLYIGEWMHKQQLNILDFGDGNESYKYDFANKERKLHSIFISKKRNLPFILKAKLTALVRNNAALIQWYRDKLRPALLLLKGRFSNAYLYPCMLIHLQMLSMEIQPCVL